MTEPIEARMPDGTVLRFPAGTADDVVDRVARQHIAQSQPPGAGERFAMGAGDIVRGAEQIGARTMDRSPDGGMLGRLLRSNPNIAAQMDAATAAVPPLTAPAVDARVQQREQDYQARRGPDAGMDWARAGGQVASSLPAAALLPAGGGLLPAAGAGALQGGMLGALQPVTGGDFAATKKQQIEMGAMFGAGGGALGQVAGRLLSPRVSPNVQSLHREGVEMTPGQMVGGTARSLEDKAMSIPVLGDMIRNSRIRGIESFNRATANRVLREIGEEVPEGMPVGRAMVAHVADRSEAAYAAALSRVQPFAPDQQFAQELADVARTQFVTPERQQRFFDYLRENVVSRIRNNQLDGETFKNIDIVLGEARRRAGGMTNLADREVGDFAEAIQAAWRGLLARSNPAAAPAVRAADAAHAVRVRFDAAARSPGAHEGVFTPAQLSSAVSRADHSARGNAFARGDALVQDLSDAGVSVLPSTVPNSGSADRIFAGALATGGAGATGFVSWPVVAGMGAAAAAYTSPVQRALAAAMARNPSLASRLTGDALVASGGPLAATLLAPRPPNRSEQRR